MTTNQATEICCHTTEILAKVLESAVSLLTQIQKSIMDSITSAIVQPLVDFVKRHLNFFVSSSNYVRNMNATLSKLDGAEKDINTLRGLNELNNRYVPSNVTDWLRDYKKITESAKKIPAHEIEWFNIKTKYETGKISFGILKDIDRLMEEKSKMPFTNDKLPLSMVSPSRPSTSIAVHVDDQNQNKNNIKSRDLIFNDVMKSLQPTSPRTQKMALCGMGGVGKSKMMEQLVKAAGDKNFFRYIVEVPVGKNPIKINVQQSVAESLGGGLVETMLDTRAKSLQKRFEVISEEGKNKILVILVDVFEVFDLKLIGLTSPLINGLKLLLISREETVCSRMHIEASLLFKIKPLEEPEDRELFWKTTRLGSTDNIRADVYKIGEDIIKRCGGLPLALTAIASALGDNQEVQEWEDTLYRLQKNSCNAYDIKEIFEISYENLKEGDLKAIFLLSGLFPGGYNISKEDLLWYGWGLRLFQNVHTIAEARKRVHTCVNQLIRSNMLIESGQEGTVKIHDLVREFVLKKSTEVNQASIVNLNDVLQEGQSYERILFKFGDMFEFPVNFNQPNLRLLKLMGMYNTAKFPEDFYTRIEKLEVVAFENVYGVLLPQYSTNLRALSIYSCSLVDDGISFLGELINLEILSLVNCRIYKLPSKIEILKRLRLLEVRGCDVLHSTIDVCVLQSLEKLEELYLGGVSFSNVVNLKELKMLLSKVSALQVEFYTNKELAKFMSFKKLQRFKIYIGCRFKEKTLREVYSYILDAAEDNDDTDLYLFRNTLKLVTSRSELLQCGVNELFKKTKILRLEVNDMKHLEDVSTYPPQDSFRNLKALDVFDCTRLEYLFTASVAKGLKELECLKIRCCHVLKSVVNGENSGVIKLENLKILYLVDLPELVSLCDSFHVMELPQLVELHLCQLDKITSIFSENYINISANQPLLDRKVVIPKLEKLKVYDMQNLKEIWPCEITRTEAEVVSTLREIEVKGCDSLVNLFPSNPMQLLCHLEELSVDECYSIEVLFNIDLGKTEQLSSNNSLRSIKVVRAATLREVCRIKDVASIHSGLLIPGFQALQYIRIMSCERLRNIVTPTTANFDMRALKDIDISYCGSYDDERKNELLRNSQEQKINTMSKEEPSQPQVGAFMSVVVLPSYEINWHYLHEIRLTFVEGVEVVFEIQSPNNRDGSVTPQEKQPPLRLLPHLKNLKLKQMKNLIDVWKYTNWNEFFILHTNQPQLTAFESLTTIYLGYCKSIKYLFSPITVKLLSNLEQVTIAYCGSMEQLVSNTGEEMITSTSAHTPTTLFPRLHTLELSWLDNLKHIGGGFSMKFPNLRTLSIRNCHCLQNVFTFSTLESLSKLETLMIRDCRDMQVIVREECGDYTTDDDVVFPHLKSIELSDLPNLEGFLLGMNINFQLPLLDSVTIKHCPKMMAFTSGQSTTPMLKYIQTEIGTHNPEHGLNFQTPPPGLGLYRRHLSVHNLMDVKFKRQHDFKIMISFNLLLHLQKLEVMHVEDCDSVEEVFEVALEVTNTESHTAVKIPKLREVKLNRLPSLKNIWKSHGRILEFPNLTTLSIDRCRSLEHVFTYSMVGCVMQLQELNIVSCRNMKVIVKEEEDCDPKFSEISFPCLKSIKLKYLSECKGFCLGKAEITFMSLDTLKIKDCKEITVFSEGRSIAPRLRVVETSAGFFNVGADINTFIVTKKQEGYNFTE